MEASSLKTIVISSDSDYKWAANRIEMLSNANPGTAEAKELKVLVKAIAEYHRKAK